MSPSQARGIGPSGDAREYAFGQWVRLWLRRRIAAHDFGPVDGILSMLEEGLRPESSGSFAFPPQDIEGADADGEAIRLRLHFLGLTGASSPLPSFFVEDLARDRESSPALRDFLRIFERRAYRLYAWVILQRMVWTRAEFGALDPMTKRLMAWAGDGRSEAEPDPGRRLRGLALLGSAVRSARGLQRYLSMQLSEGEVEVFDRGECWFATPSQARLGRTALGGDAVLGKRMRTAGEAIAIRIGPLSWHRYQEYAQDRPATQVRLARLLADYLDRPRPWKVVFELDPATAPESAMLLGAQMRLGRHAWIGESSRQSVCLVFASASMGGNAK